MQTVLLQPWTTISSGLSGFTQDEGQWTDLACHSEIAGVWLDISQVTGSNVQLQLQTSPSHDEAYFMPLTPFLTLSAASKPTFFQTPRTPTTPPLSRWVRWQLTGTGVSWGATFRIRAAVAKQPDFVPTDLPGCVQWLRADLGITHHTSITHVQSGKNISAGAVPTLPAGLTNPVP